MVLRNTFKLKAFLKPKNMTRPISFCIHGSNRKECASKNDSSAQISEDKGSQE